MGGKTNYVTRTRFILKCFGVNLKDNSLFAVITGWIGVSLTTAVFILNGFSILRGYLAGDNSSDLSSTVSSLSMSAGFMIRLLQMQYKWRYTYDEMFTFVDGWIDADNSFSKRFRLLYNGLQYFTVGLLIYYSLSPILTMKLSVEPYLPVWDHTHLAGFIGAQFLIALSVVASFFSLFSTDYTAFFCCVGIYNRLQNLKENFEKIKSDDDIEFLVKCIRDHQEIMRKVKVLEVSCKPLFFQAAISVYMGACFYTVTALERRGEGAVVFAQVLLGSLNLFWLFFMYCWMGQNITNASEELHFSVYNNEWYKTNKKMKNMLLLIQQYTLHPIEIKAYVTPISLQTFHSVASDSYSFLMLLLSTT